MARSFFDFFPAPRFLEMPAPGLSLTDAGVRLIEFKQEHNKLLLKQYGEADFPEGTVVSGAIQNIEVLTKILEDFRRKHGIQYVRTMLPEERAYLFRTKVPNLADKDIRTSVEFTIEENVPLSVSETVFDYTVVSETKNADGSEALEVSVSVIPQEVVNEYLEVFQKAGFTPLHFEVESQAIAKAIVPYDDKRTLLIINIGKQRAGLYLVSKGMVAFSSTVPISLPEEKLAVKSELSYTAMDKEGKEVPSLAVPGYGGLSTALDEIKKIFLYWQTQTDEEGKSLSPVEAIIICGEEGQRQGVPEYFSEKAGIPAHLGNVWGNAFSFHDYVPDIPLEKSLGYAGAVGLALSHSING